VKSVTTNRSKNRRRNRKSNEDETETAHGFDLNTNRRRRNEEPHGEKGGGGGRELGDLPPTSSCPMPERPSVSRSCWTRRLCQSRGPRGGHASKLASGHRAGQVPAALCAFCRSSTSQYAERAERPARQIYRENCERKRRGVGGWRRKKESSNGDGSRAGGPNRGFIFCGVPFLPSGSLRIHRYATAPALPELPPCGPWQFGD
jgi:hypothetical protein